MIEIPSGEALTAMHLRSRERHTTAAHRNPTDLYIPERVGHCASDNAPLSDEPRRLKTDQSTPIPSLAAIPQDSTGITIDNHSRSVVSDQSAGMQTEMLRYAALSVTVQDDTFDIVAHEPTEAVFTRKSTSRATTDDLADHIRPHQATEAFALAAAVDVGVRG